MKVEKIKNIDSFFDLVDECEGTVDLVTGDGDRLNLKSKLCQYVSMATLFSGDASEDLDLTLEITDPDTEKKIAAFLAAEGGK